MELKRREASVNGTLKDSSPRMENGALVISLRHGGGEILLSQHADRVLSQLIEEEFGVTVPVRFDGVLSIEESNPVHIERMKKTEEKKRREATVEYGG